MRSTMRSGQPKNISAPTITKKPSTKRVIGEEPPCARNSLPAMDIISAPNTKPMISGRIYCTMAA